MCGFLCLSIVFQSQHGYVIKLRGTRCKAVGLNRYSEGGGPDRFEQYLSDIFEKITGGSDAE